MAGAPVPRIPAEINGGCGSMVLTKAKQANVFDAIGDDVTALFVAEAKLTLKKVAILKERSPSCGSSTIYDGTFSGSKIPGSGVAAALLKQNGVVVFSEQKVDQAIVYLNSMNTVN